MKAIIIASTLFLIVLFASCGEPVSEESQNIAAILSPDGTQIAFARSFYYYVTKASVFDPGGWRDTKYIAVFIYTMDRSTKKVTKLTDVTGRYQNYPYYCYGEYCPIHISWEGGSIAYSFDETIDVMNPDGSDKRPVMTFKDAPRPVFTLSTDGQRLFYLINYYDRAGLYSVNLDGTGKSFVTNFGSLMYNIRDMVWDSSKKRILLIERTYDSKEPVVWQINPDGTDLRKSEDGLVEYRRRRLGGWESKPPFAELEKLTRDITYAEWGVPAPDEF